MFIVNIGTCKVSYKANKMSEAQRDINFLKPQSHYSDNQSPTSRRPTTISNYQQPISNQNFSPQSVADCLPTDRRLFADRSPSGRQPIANYSPTDYRTSIL